MAHVLAGPAPFEHCERSHLCVHTRGRLEDQELSLLHHDGRIFSDPSALSSAAENGEAIYAQLSDSALHDFERRIDQLQHLQIGYICDQFVTFRHEHTEILQDVSLLRSALEKEQIIRESREDSIRQAMDEIQKKVDVQGNTSRLSEQLLREQLQTTMASVEHVIKCQEEQTLGREGAPSMRAEAAKAQRSIAAELQDVYKAQKIMAAEIENIHKALDTERSARCAGNAKSAAAVDEVRSQLHSEERRIPADVLSLIEASVEAERLARQKALAELTHQLSIAVESIQDEQALRSSEDSDLTQMIEGLRRSNDEIRHCQHETNLQVARSISDLTKRLEDDMRTREGLMSKLQSAANRLDSKSECDKEQASCTVSDIVKRFDDEVRDRAKEISMLQSLVCEERDIRQEHDNKINRAIAALQEVVAEEREQRDRDSRDNVDHIESCLETCRTERKERIAAIKELLDSLPHMSSRLSEQHLPQNTAWAKEIRELVEAERATRVADYKSLVGRTDEALRLAREFEASAGLVSQLLHAVSQETKDRKNADDSLNHKLQEALRQFGAIDQKLLEDEEVHSDISMLREGLGQVVEALQQERRSRHDHDDKLRKDCCESVQKEVTSRLERDAKLREDIKAESLARVKAIEIMEESVSRWRSDLEGLVREAAHVTPESTSTSRIVPTIAGTTVHERSPHLQTMSPVRESGRLLLRTYSRSPSPNGRVAKEVLQSPHAKLACELRPVHGDVVQTGSISVAAVLPGYSAQRAQHK